METKLESLTRPEDLRTAAFKFRKNNPSSVSHDSAAMYIELSADRIEQLRQRVAELEGWQASAENRREIQRQREEQITTLRQRVAEQLETIQALNSCIGGENSTTTENLIRVSRLEQQRDELMAAATKAAEQIRKCDYTPARSTLLVAIASVKEKLNDSY